MQDDGADLKIMSWQTIEDLHLETIIVFNLLHFNKFCISPIVDDCLLFQ